MTASSVSAASLETTVPSEWESSLRWGVFTTFLGLLSFGLGLLIPTLIIGIASLVVAWAFLVLTLLVMLRSVDFHWRILLTVIVSAIAGLGLIWIVRHPPRSEILAAIRGVPDTVYNRIAPLLRPLGTSNPTTGSSVQRSFPSRKEAGVDPTGTGRADLKLEFVGKEKLQFLYFDDAPESANEPKRYFGLFDINHPYYFDEYPGVIQPLPLLFKTEMDFVFHNNKTGPSDVIDNPEAASRVKRGDRLFGMADVLCLNCKRERSYWVFFEVGTGGWYAEMDKPPWGGTILVPRPNFSVEQQIAVMDKQVSTAHRIEIPEK